MCLINRSIIAVILSCTVVISSAHAQEGPTLEQTEKWVHANISDRRTGFVEAKDCRLRIRNQGEDSEHYGNRLIVDFSKILPSRIDINPGPLNGWNERIWSSYNIEISAGSCVTNGAWGEDGCPNTLLFALHGVQSNDHDKAMEFRRALRRWAELCNPNAANADLFAAPD